MNQNINIWTLPSATQMLGDIRAELSQGVSICIIVAMPNDILEFKNVLCSDLERQDGLVTCSLHLSDLEAISFASLQRAINGPDCETVRLDQFMQSGTTPDVIFLEGFSRISNPLQTDTVSLIRRWVDYCHSSPNKKSLCLIVSGDLADKINEVRLSTTSTSLKIRCLVGIPSALDMRLICRAQTGGGFISAESHWIESLVSSLSGNDLEIAYLLRESKLSTLDDINQILENYAESNSWKCSVFEDELKEWIPLVSGVKPEIPFYIKNMKLIQKQITVYTPEYGEEIHPAGLTLLKRYDDIKRRVWRSQMTLVLPIIDELRINTYLLIKNQISEFWDYDEIPEIGELKHCLDQLPFDSKEKDQFFDVILKARNVRNKLAHIDVITFREYEYLWRSGQKIKQMSVK